jgi:hypothetical protein
MTPTAGKPRPVLWSKPSIATACTIASMLISAAPAGAAVVAGTTPATPSANAVPPATPAPRDAATVEQEGKPRDCAFGLVVWCLSETDPDPGPPPGRVRVELFGGWKPNNLYYKDEIRACEAAGCDLKFSGPAFGLDAFYNLSGDPRSSRYFDLGVSASYMPIVSGIQNNARGFAGQLGPVEPGDGLLGYVPVRLTIRRPNWFLLFSSKYIVSSFGAGLAFPVTSGSGASFTGGDSPKLTVGGKIGAQIPIADGYYVGATTAWTVVWFGSSFGDASFQTAYGLHVAALL